MRPPGQGMPPVAQTPYPPRPYEHQQRSQQYYSQPMGQQVFDQSKFRPQNHVHMQRALSTPPMTAKMNFGPQQPIKPLNRFPNDYPGYDFAKIHPDSRMNPMLPAKPETVEATEPILRKIYKRNLIAPVDLRKVVMCLKSGLLAETTWAIDTLNIVSSNERFRLASIPNLLVNLVDYYKCFLNTVFDDLFADTENDYQMKILKHFKSEHEDEAKQYEKLIKKGDKLSLLDSVNYTFKTRNGLPVKVKEDSILAFRQSVEEFQQLEETCDHEYFNNGNTLTSAHIIETMLPKQPIPLSKKAANKNAADNETLDGLCKSIREKRKYSTDPETDSYPSYQVLCPRAEAVDILLKRCFCISNIITNLSFMPENFQLMSTFSPLLLVLGRILLYEHKHMYKKNFKNVLLENENKTSEAEKLEACEIFKDNLFDGLHLIRMNSFVTLSNLSEFLDLSTFSDKIILPILDSLLHWATCDSSHAKDVNTSDNLSYQLITLEILAKLCISGSNVDLILATPPFARLEEFYKILVNQIDKTNDLVLRELSLVILANFVKHDSLSARIVLHQNFAISNLLYFIEQHESFQRKRYTPGYNYRIDPYAETPTIAYMCKLAISTLLAITNECDKSDWHLIKRFESRLVNLAMSPFLEPELLAILANLVYTLSSKSIP